MPARVRIVRESTNSRVTRGQFYGKGIFTGVCAGIAERFHINVTLLRILWGLSCFLFGFGVFAYVFMTIILPEEDLDK